MLSGRRPAMRGMTLVELMVTLAVAAILMFAVAPDIGEWMRSLQVRNTAEQLQAGLQRARNEAIKRNTPVRFSLVRLANPATMDNSCALSAAAGSWVVSLLDPSGKCGATDPTADPMMIDQHAAADGGRDAVVAAWQDAAATIAADSITFDGFGRASGAGIARIDVTHATAPSVRALRIVVASGGSVRMCDPSSSIATNDPRHC
jgi:type IV fimbrial biogenesis protein FimT